MKMGTHHRIGRADIQYRAARMEEVLNKVKEAALRPESRKVAPRINLTNTAEILNLTKSQMIHRLAKGKFTGGDRSGARTWFTLEEVQSMARAAGLRHAYAEGHGIVMTVANFKGGVLKTSTTVTLAQYLSSRGLNCLVIDLDPQASATTLFGISPYLDVETDQSAHGLFEGDGADPMGCIRKTYWPGVDLIPANQFLYGREFALAAVAKDWGGDVFAYLGDLLPPLRAKYDVILIDTQPTLGFLTSNAIFGADHLLVTVPPSALDFASSVIFWALLRDVMLSAENAKGTPKYWDNVSVLLTKLDNQDKSTHINRQLLTMGCEDWLLPEPIPATRVATNASAEFSTVYDIERYEGGHKSFKSARENYDRAYAQILNILNRTWDVWQHPEQWAITQTPESGDLFAKQASNDVVEQPQPEALAS